MPHSSPLLKNTCVRQVVLDKWFPLTLEKSNCGKTSFWSAKSGAGEQFLVLACMAKVRPRGVCFVHGRRCRQSGGVRGGEKGRVVREALPVFILFNALPLGGTDRAGRKCQGGSCSACESYKAGTSWMVQQVCACVSECRKTRYPLLPMIHVTVCTRRTINLPCIHPRCSRQHSCGPPLLRERGP